MPVKKTTRKKTKAPDVQTTVQVPIGRHTIKELEALGLEIVIEPTDIYSKRDAAAYYNITTAALDYRIHKASSRLTPLRRMGYEMVFTRPLLDDYQKTVLPAYRPSNLSKSKQDLESESE